MWIFSLIMTVIQNFLGIPMSMIQGRFSFGIVIHILMTKMVWHQWPSVIQGRYFSTILRAIYSHSHLIFWGMTIAKLTLRSVNLCTAPANFQNNFQNIFHYLLYSCLLFCVFFPSLLFDWYKKRPLNYELVLQTQSTVDISISTPAHL